MRQWLREIRLVPILLIGVGCLLVLKVTGLVLDGGYSLGHRMNRGETMVVTTVPASSAVKMRSEAVPLNVAAAPPGNSKPWMREVFNYPEVTGSVPAAKPPAAAAKPPDTKPPDTKPAANVPPAEPPQTSAAERAVLERLQERRQQLDVRARELDIRESMLRAAEQKLEKPASDPRDQTAQNLVAGQRKDEPEIGRYKNLVTMYETMKPKDAAKIFDRLDIKVLLEVSTLINPRKMSEILAVMSPEAAERLTVELATHARNPDRGPSPAELPKIEGKPL